MHRRKERRLEARGKSLLFAGLVLSWSGAAMAGPPETALSLELRGTAGPSEVAEASGTRRFALVVGANDGGGERDLLRFAGTDAKQVAKVLGDLGGVAQSDRLVVLDPDPDALRAAFSAMEAKLRAARNAGERAQFVFYYSGHSDERGLLLGGVVVPYKDLRALIEQVPADVRLAVLDSCASGAFTRLKGGTKRAPLLVKGGEVEGHAFLTSSSADEAAQESDRIGGSFFTHYFVTGLRGAADSNADRQVTLNEAYRFAFDETLARTELSEGGAQHAAYAIRLSGTGDLVMTDLRQATAKLEVQESVGGRLYIRDAGGKLVAELYKPAGSGAVMLALEPGEYRVTLDDGHRLYAAKALVSDQAAASLELGDFTAVDPEATRTRGDAGELDPGEAPSEYRVIPFDVGLTPSLSLNGEEKQKKVINQGSLSFGWSRNARTQGVAFGIGATISTEEVRGAQVAGLFTKTRHLDGAQLGGGLALATGRVEGFQHAWGGTIAGEQLEGVQAGTVFNLARGPSRGAQLSAGVNLVDDLQGLQIGLINVGRGQVGTQIGLINYAEDAKASIALLPITKRGLAGEFWTSDTALLNLALRFRAKYTFAFWTAGLHPFGEGRGTQAGMGFGGRVPLGKKQRGFIELDLATFAVFPRYRGNDTQLMGKLRLTGGARFGKRFELWGGATANGLFDFLKGSDTRPGYAWTSYRYEDPAGDFRLKVWPGFVFGVRF